MFDQVKGVIQIAEELKERLEGQSREIDEIMEIVQGEQVSRTTVDQRDKFMMQLDKLTEGLNSNKSALFTYKEDIIKRLE